MNWINSIAINAQKVKELPTIKLLIKLKRICFNQSDRNQLIAQMERNIIELYEYRLISIGLVVYDNQNNAKTLIWLTNGIHTKCTCNST